jgi:hypothetical protein
MININYDIFFTVELLHKYFGAEACNDFLIVPTTATQNILNGYHIMIKQFGSKLYAYIQTDDSKRPFLIPEEGTQLTFLLQLKSPSFFNYTDLENNGIFYFSNRVNNVSNARNFLSEPIDPHVNATHYQNGDIALDTADNFIYQSLVRDNTNPLNDTAAWRKVDENRYVISVKDVLTWVPSVYNFPVNTATTPVTVSGFGYDGAGGYTKLLFSNLTAVKDAAVPIDFSAFPPGKYILKIDSDEYPIYINDELKNNTVFGVIELFVESTLAPDYLVLKQDVINPDENNKLLAPAYFIYFLNRTTIWKYVLNPNSKGQISAAGFSFPASDENPIFSLTPIPLSERPITANLQFSTIINGHPTPTINISPMDCASPERIINYQPNPPTGEVFHCSEIFLNY